MCTLRFVLLSVLAAGSAAAQNYTLSTFAGGALPVNVPSTSVDLSGFNVGVSPSSMAVDASGNLFFPYQEAEHTVSVAMAARLPSLNSRCPRGLPWIPPATSISPTC